MPDPHRLLPFLDWPRPDRALLRTDLPAGIAVGLMIIPQGMAYAVLAGMPAVTGIYAAMLPPLIAALFGSSVRLSAGPTALTCLLSGASVAGLAEPGSTQWVTLTVWLALLSGGLQILLGVLRFGWLMNLVSAPVLSAFTQAAALLIIASQLPGLLGTRPGGHWWSPEDLHPVSMAFGLGSLALLWAARQWRPGFPTILVLLLGSAALSQGIGFEAGGGAVVGLIPDHLPTLQLPAWPDPSVLGQLLLPMLTVTLVSFLETASGARVEADRAGRPWEQNRDLVGQGLAKLASGLLGAFPTSTSFSRSALYLYLGARSGWATVITSLLVAVVLLFMTPLLHHAPRPVLAAIVIVAVIGVLRPTTFARTWRISRAEALIGAITFGVTLLAMPELHWGVLVGVLMALSHSVYQRLHPRIVDVGLHADGSLRDRALWALPPLAPQVCALRMDAALDFATAHAFERAVTERIVADPNLRAVCLFAQSINRIDATGVETFVKLRARLGAAGITLHLTGLKQPVEQALRAAGALTDDVDLHLHRTDAEAIEQLREHHDKEHR